MLQKSRGAFLVATIEREKQLYLSEKKNSLKDGGQAVPGRHLLGSLNGPELHVEARVPEIATIDWERRCHVGRAGFGEPQHKGQPGF